MSLRLGMVGVSPGNGHPFSFSAIINGYSPDGLEDSGWNVIYDYIRRRDSAEIGLPGARVTHVWTQEPETTTRLREACLIANAVDDPAQMIDHVDAVIIARDDYDLHAELAMPFLKAGKAVFVDKPLSLDEAELRAFRPYLLSGKLVSCSAMRYATELDEPRANLASYGPLLLIRCAVLNSWEKYGIHMLDAVAGLMPIESEWVEAADASHVSVRIGGGTTPPIQVDALGESSPVFQIDLFGRDLASTHSMRDNFSMFRRMLWHFCRAVDTGEPPFDPRETLTAMRLLIAGRRSRETGSRVFLHDIDV